MLLEQRTHRSTIQTAIALSPRRRDAYGRAGLVRTAIDELLGSTPDEFRVEGDLVAIGPIYDDNAFAELMKQCELQGLEFYDDFFELTGNWPEWLTVLASASPPV